MPIQMYIYCILGTVIKLNFAFQMSIHNPLLPLIRILENMSTRANLCMCVRARISFTNYRPKSLEFEKYKYTPENLLFVDQFILNYKLQSSLRLSNSVLTQRLLSNGYLLSRD